MPTILIASLQPGEGRSATAAGLGGCLAAGGKGVRLLRLRASEGADAAADSDARTLAIVPGCASPAGAVGEKEAEAEARDAESKGEFCLIETPPGIPTELAGPLPGRVVLVTKETDDQRRGELAAARDGLGDALLGVVVTRQAERRMDGVRAAFEEDGLPCLAVLAEDRLLAGPTVREMAEALGASRLAGNGGEDEAVEHVMLGPVSADPGQPYFLQHGRKAVVNRFDRMDLHLAALATEPDCLILTGGQQPSPYLLDRVEGRGVDVTVLLAPDGSVGTIEALDELYGRTRLAGGRKVERAIELFEQHADIQQLREALG